MLELEAVTIRREIDLNPDICRRFKDPIVFYLTHRNDRRFFFITFVILDLQKREISYITTYLPENIKKVENHKKQEKYKAASYSDPHCSIKINNKNEFVSFPEDGEYFYRVFPDRNKVRVYLADGIGVNGEAELKEFGSTFYKAEEDGKNYFYFTAIDKQKKDYPILNFFRSGLDISDIRKVFSTPISRFMNAPHATRKFGQFLISSDFSSRKYKNKKTGLVFETQGEMVRSVYEELYKEYCNSKGIIFSKENFYQKNRILRKEITLEREFSVFCESRGKNFLDVCSSDSQFDFSVLPGKISFVDLRKQTINFLETTFCAPAHFEIDDQKGAVYTCSHNFSRVDKLYYFGPAAIDKFLVKNGHFKKVATFTDQTGYRMTNCKIFHYQGKSYLSSIGQPNRLFIIDAETMTKLFCDDIGENVLSSQKDIRYFLNNSDLENITLRALEISDDGELIFILSNKYIYFYSFPERRLLTRLPYHDNIPILGGNTTLYDFFQRTSHCDYLR